MTASPAHRPAHCETELKLALPAGQVPLFERLMARRRSVPVRQQLVTRYFDTPDFALGRRGIALRLRRVGGRRWLQTLKTAGASGGGLSQRGEYETPVPHGALDWTRLAPEALAQVPEALRGELAPLFETRVKRSVWQVRGPAGARIEVALDVGELRAGARALALCEVEFELKRGRPDALAALALDWSRRTQGGRPLGWLPLDASKAERGIRLVRGERAAPPVPGAPVALAAEASVAAGLVAVCAACLAQFQANLPGVLGDADIEYVHQARVALQRLRVALRLLRRMHRLPPDELLAGLRALAAALGPARDWDVLCDMTLPALAAGFDDARAWQRMMLALQSRRAAVRRAMQAAIVQVRPAEWLLLFHRWLALEPAGVGVPVRNEALQTWARHALQAGHEKIVRGARDFARQGPAQRHRLRLYVKRQRYAAEFFQTLHVGRPYATYQRELHELQTSLGRANDVHVARALLAGAWQGSGAGLDAAARGAIRFTQGWLARQAAEPPEPTILQGLKSIKKFRAF